MTNFLPSKRQSSILDMVEDYGFVATEAMVSKFEVTPQTIRRDLNELSVHGLLTRFHGGAGQVKSAENGASIFLSTGTTIEVIAEALLSHERLHIFTNNLHVAQILTRNETFRIIVACGQVRHSDGGITGASTEDFISDFRMDIGIVGVSGIDEDGTLLEYDPNEVKTAKTILKNSQKIIMVADHLKFGQCARR